MLVVDASALVELLLGRSAGAAVVGHLEHHGLDMHAPHLVDVEVTSALRRLVAAGEASSERASEALEDLLDIAIERYPHDFLLPRVWELRRAFSAYDATYVALAEILDVTGVPLLTADRRLADAVHSQTTVKALLAR